MIQPNNYQIARRAFLATTAAAAGSLVLPAAAQSPTFPTGPIKIVIPLAAGGAADAIVRPIAIELEKSLGQPVIIDNRPGGLFMIGLQAVLSAPPTGHTLFYVYNSTAAVQAVHKRFDLNRQLEPVTQILRLPMVLMVAGNSPFMTVGDLVQHARKNPGALTYGSNGAGSTEHLKAVQLERAGGFSAQHIPYKSGPESIKSLIAGDTSFQCGALTFALNFAPKKQIRVLAVMSDSRLPEFPNVPTIVEAGLKVDPLVYWGGFSVRADTPPAIVKQLHASISAVVAMPSVRERVAATGANLVSSATPADFKRLIDSEIRWTSEASEGLKLEVN